MKKGRKILCALLLFACVSGCGQIREEEEPVESIEGIKSEESAGSMDSAADTQARQEAAEGNIIEEQSFETELDGWGKIRFASVAPKGGQGAPHFILIRDGETVYTFPENDLPKTDQFAEVSAVSFEDYNQDGKKDVIVLIGYQNGADVWTEVQIFLQENPDNMFYLDYPDMADYRIDAPTEAGPAFYRDGFLEEYLSVRGLVDAVSDITGTWSEYVDYVGGLGGYMNVNKQIALFAKNRAVWAAEAEYANDRHCFAVADLDYDGLLELIVANQGGTGNYTYSRFYKPDEEGNLKELESSFTEGASEPDIIEGEMTVYSSFSADGIRDYYIVYDDLKVSADCYVYRVSSLCMVDDYILETPLAIQTVTYEGEDFTAHTVSEDCNGNPITEEEYSNFPENYYGDMGLSKKTASFLWTDVNELAGKSDEEVKELLRQSYEGFRH